MIEINYELLRFIPFFPLIGAAACFFLSGRKPSQIASNIAIAMIFMSFAVSFLTFIPFMAVATNGSTNYVLSYNVFDWISVGSLNIGATLLFDQLTAIMLFVVTFVSLLIHIYSVGYMHGDPEYNRFFCYLNLFVFFMIILVMAKNMPLMFVGWEGVGLCSYLLISFWWNDIEKARAGKKAFITNRIGDFAFIAGMMTLYWLFNNHGLTFNFDMLRMGEHIGKIANVPLFGGITIIDGICILLFIGATGKSAQFPLFVWLPDAMAGPTPVSALIHAATMVTAGVYMLARLNFLFALSPFALNVIAITGIFTAILAACIALSQSDIKKILAYSTVSQLGFMFLAAGCGAFSAAIFHLMTHAFFKSLLFLGAGSVIHSMNGEQDIYKMGGLKEKIPYTFITFFIGTYAISGLPLMSGFFSKDEIVLYTFFGRYANSAFYIFASLTSLMTAFYMHRLLFLTFFGKFRGDAQTLSHVHESPRVMTIPLAILAFFSAISGFITFSPEFKFENFLSSVIALKPLEKELSHNTEISFMIIAVIIALIGAGSAFYLYLGKNKILDNFNKMFEWAVSITQNKFFIDEIYEYLIIKPLYSISNFIFKYIDKKVIDEWAVDGPAKFTMKFAAAFSRLQTGSIQDYISALIAGAAVFALYIFWVSHKI